MTLRQKRTMDKRPHLLELFNARATLIEQMPLDYRPPVLDLKYRNQLEVAADLHAEANQSDPFARARVALHMRRGLILPSDVSKEARAVLTDRQRRVALQADTIAA